MDVGAFLKRRSEGVLDNVVGGLVLLVVVAGIVAGVAFGGRSVGVKGWEVILLGVVLVGLALGETLLFRRTTSHRVTMAPERGPHDELLIRLRSLETDLETGPEYISWHVARVYNKLLADAIRDCHTTDFRGLQEIAVAPGGTGYAMIDRSSLRALARQLRSLVEAAD